MKVSEGAVLGGRYRLTSQIAVGGMGEVWVAHDTALNRDIAVKVLKEEFAGDAGFLDRFRTEARNAGSLSHPNIAQLYDYREHDGTAYLVMELVAGEPMSDLLEREPVLPPERLLPILAQTARALHAAHQAGVVHRDVKPGNILLTPDGAVKITDFGVSLASNQIPMTATGMVMGTAQYLSPEQAVGHAATPASDLYSLGIVAYECLAGHRPFTGPTAVDIAVAHVRVPVPPLPATVDPALGDLVMRMLAKNPAERPRSAASLARSFEAMSAALPAAPAPGGRATVRLPGSPARARAPVQRTSVLTAQPGAGSPEPAAPGQVGPDRRGPGRARPGSSAIAPGAPAPARRAARAPRRRNLHRAGPPGTAAPGRRRRPPRWGAPPRTVLALVVLALVLIGLAGAALAGQLFGAAAPEPGPAVAVAAPSRPHLRPDTLGEAPPDGMISAHAPVPTTTKEA